MGTGLLQGRRAVVTGASRGLGRAIADRFAGEGAEVWIVDLPAALDPTQNAAGVLGVDLADPGAETALAALAARLETVDAVVANAGEVPPWRASRRWSAPNGTASSRSTCGAQPRPSRRSRTRWRPRGGARRC